MSPQVLGNDHDLSNSEVLSLDPLGNRLVDYGKLRANELKRVMPLLKPGESLAHLLIKLGLVSEVDVADGLAGMLDLKPLQSSDYPAVAVNQTPLSLRFLKNAKVVPVREDEDHVELAMADPRANDVQNAVAVACRKSVTPRLGLSSDIEATIDRCYGAGKSSLGQLVEDIETVDTDTEFDVEQLKDLASEAPVIRLVNLLIQRAVEAGASDIHIEPFEDALTVRYRVDGVLRAVEAPPSRFTPAVVSRIKIMAKLNIAERRLPQDGRIMLKVLGKDVDLRVSSVPTLYGESVVMRLLQKDSVIFDFDPLGFDAKTRERYQELLGLPHGIILVTGPTGSGKTTTLYTALNMLNKTERKILTVEDPVEYQLQGINQIQVKPQIGLSFANALRSMLRQDPDVIMIGEMRDLETARIAVQSALTGHLVLSTLHTNDAASGVTRLLDMGVEDYLLTSTVNGILAQRLVRTLCPTCRAPYPAMPETVDELRLHEFTDRDPVTLHRAVGCEQCEGNGYRGRTAVLELLCVTDEVRRLVLQHAESAEILRTARSQGMRTMHEDGILKALNGTTTIEEVLRVTQEF
ncbi:MAG: type II secretion system ATPase GspE [Gammaproteobacteria bacterium]|nr:type II secretion system ATPase GspE [Gammaproteobacteria bacterium]